MNLPGHGLHKLRDDPEHPSEGGGRPKPFIARHSPAGTSFVIHTPAMPRAPLTVFKFGGTSVGAPDRLRRVVDVVTAAAGEGQVVVVASALSNVTRQLSGGLETFVAHLNGGREDPEAVRRELRATLRARHTAQAEAVLSPAMQARYAVVVEERLADLNETLAAVREEGFTPARRDAVLAIGEQLSVPMVHCALHDAGLVAPLGDATRRVVTDDTFGEAAVQLKATTRAVRAWHAACPDGSVPVIAGFIGGTPGEAGAVTTTTLGFEGSDYSAALVAAILDADRLIRYTDVDGLYTDDPRQHPGATRIEQLSMEKAFALTESGRLGMHSKTLRPLAQTGIPLYIRSILDPEAPGTAIVPKSVAVAKRGPTAGRG